MSEADLPRTPDTDVESAHRITIDPESDMGQAAVAAIEGIRAAQQESAQLRDQVEPGRGRIYRPQRRRRATLADVIGADRVAELDREARESRARAERVWAQLQQRQRAIGSVAIAEDDPYDG